MPSLALLRGRGGNPGAGLEPAGGAGEGDCSENEGTGVSPSDYGGCQRRGRWFCGGEVTGGYSGFSVAGKDGSQRAKG